MELANNKTTPSKNHQDNGATSPLGTQPFFPNLPSIDASYAPESLPLLSFVDVATTTRLSSTGNLPGVRLMVASNALSGVYQYWVHQNPSTHLGDGVNEDVKWQAR